MLVLTILLNLLSVLGIVFIYLILLIRSKQSVYSNFAIFCLLAASWLGLQFLSQFIFQEYALYLIRLSTVFSSFLPIPFLGFTNLFVSGNKIKNVHLIILLIVSAFFSALTFTQYGVVEVTANINGISVNKSGYIFTANSVYITLLFTFSLIRILRFTVNGKVNPQKKAAAKILFLGLLFALVSSFLSAVIFAKIEEVQLLIPLSFLILALTVYYAIFKHKLFNISFVIARSLAYVLSLTFLALTYGFVIFSISRIVTGGTNLNINQLVIDIIFAILVGISFQPSKKIFDKVTNAIFYRDAYEPQVLLGSLSNNFIKTLDMKSLLDTSLSILVSTFKSTSGALVLNSEDSQPIFSVQNYSISKIKSFCELNDLLHKIPNNITVVDNLHPSEVKRNLEKNSVALAVKLSSLKGEIGYIYLSERKSGSLYTESDLDVLELVSNELALAIENARRYSEITRFNSTLQKKIDDATKELKRTNDKLQALDTAKDEFISMASHQLRTPLTSVKGYVSMVLDGDAGPITDQQRQLLQQSFLSSQRMVYLIADLLNVSRLRTGKFIIEAKPTYLPDVVESELEQLADTYKARGLDVVFNKPAKFPVLMLDETKIRQVIMNFTDNAIYYTPSGGRIEIVLRETPHAIEFDVNDSGIGVPKAEQHHLFTKFYRAHNAKRARPDGTGLGLFMAKKVIVAQGGSVVFRSTEGKGSTFGFTFPKHKLLVGAKPKHSA